MPGRIPALLVVPLLAGCAASALGVAADVASTGISAYQEYGPGAGEPIEAAFSGSPVPAEDEAPLRAVDSLAIWPDERNASVPLAEQLMERGMRVVTPSLVTRWANLQGLPTNASGYTTSDWQAVLAELCRAHPVGGAVVMRDRARRVEESRLSLRGPRQEMEIEVLLYGCDAGRTLWRDTLTVSTSLGAGAPGEAEVGAVVASTTAARILDLAKG